MHIFVYKQIGKLVSVYIQSNLLLFIPSWNGQA